MSFWVERCLPESGNVFYFIVEADTKDAYLENMLHAILFASTYDRHAGLPRAQPLKAKLYSGRYETREIAQRSIRAAQVDDRRLTDGQRSSLEASLLTLRNQLESQEAYIKRLEKERDVVLQ